MSHLQQPSTKLGDHENNNGGFMDTSQQQSTSSSSSSFVGKVRSTLSKWFNTPSNRNKVVVRPRSEMEADDSSNNDSDDDSDDLNLPQQSRIVLPPAKRLKTIPATATSSEFTSAGVHNNNQLRLFSQVSERNPKRLILNRRKNAVKLMRQESTGVGFSAVYLAQENKEDGLGQEVDSDATPAEVPSSSTIIQSHNRSLFDTSHDRSLFSNLQSTASTSLGVAAARPASLSARRPAFSGANLTSVADDRSAATRRIYNSPFYSGRTLYGGASNVTIGRLGAPPPQRRTHAAADTSGSTMLSTTARRILDTLESYTLDATAQPRQTNKRQLKQDHLFSRSSSKPYNRARRLDDLQVPNVAQLLKMKERLQNQTVQVRQMIKDSNQRQTSDATTTAASSSSSSSSVGGKMRAKVTTQVRPRKQPHEDDPSSEDNAVEVERLSAIQLPIGTLPKFADLQLPLPRTTTTAAAPPLPVVKTIPPLTTSAVVAPSVTGTVSAAATTPRTSTHVTTSTTVKPAPSAVGNTDDVCEMFVFAKPLVLLDSGLNGSKLRNIMAINNFKFSVPLNQKKSLHKLTQQQKPTADGVDSTDKPRQATVVSADLNSSAAAASTVVTTPNATTVPAGLKLSSNIGNQWECDVCLVRNPSTASTCVACTSARAQTATVAPSVTPTVTVTATSSISWSGTIFKPPSNRWDCDVCLVSNGNERASCAACETPKPGAAAARKTPPTPSAATWECPSCMVRNQPAVLKCVCCETLKPGSNITGGGGGGGGGGGLATTKFNFGVTTAATSTTAASAVGFTFGMPPAKQTTPPSAPFTFGIPAVATTSTLAVANGSGGNSSSAVSSTTTLNQKPVPNGMISSSSVAAAPAAAPPAATTTASAKLAAPTIVPPPAAAATTTTASAGAFAFGRPPASAQQVAAPPAFGQHVSSSTSATNGSSESHLEAKRANNSGVSSTAVPSISQPPFAPSFAPVNNKEATATSTIATTMATNDSRAPPVFSFGSAAVAAPPANNRTTTNGPLFLFGGAAPSVDSAATVAVAPTASILFSFGGGGGASVAPPGFGGGFSSASAVSVPVVRPPPAAFCASAANTAGGSNMFGQPKMKNGGFDFSASGGSGGKPPFQSVTAAPQASGGFNFAPQNFGGGVFAFGASGASAAATGHAASTGAAPFTFGAVSSSSSSAPAAANKPPPLSFGGITSSSSAPSITPITHQQQLPHTNMFGTPTPSVVGGGALSDNSGGCLLQQRRIIRKAVRRTNTQPR